MAISITGSKYGNLTLSSVATSTVTTSAAAFVAADFVAPRIVGLWDSTGASLKGFAWVRRFVSASQLELQTALFDPATGIAVTQSVNDVLLVSKNFAESVTVGLTVSGRAVNITDTGDCVFGNGTGIGVCFYDESKEIITAGIIRPQGGLTVLGKLDSYSSNSTSSPCDIQFNAGAGTTVLTSGTSNSNFLMYGGVLSGPNSPLYIGGYQGTPGRTMVFNGVQNPFDFISPSAGGAWGSNAARQQLVNCYSLTTSFNAIMRRWGDGLILGGRYKFPDFTSGPISAFGSDSAGTFTVATAPGNRAVVLDAGNGPALVRSSGGSINFNFTNLITTDFRNVTGVSGSLVANNAGTNTFSFSETFSGLQAASVGVVVNSASATEQSNTSTAATWSPSLLRRTCVGTTVTVNSTGWTYGFKKYGRQAISGAILPSLYDLGTAGQADDVVFGGVVTQLVDPFVTLSNTAALALSSKFTASSAASGSVVVTANATLDELYDYLIAWGSSTPALARFPSLSVYPISASADELTTAMVVTVNAGVTLSGGAKFKSLGSSGVTLLGSILGVTIVGSVSQPTPANLSNVTITGTLTYSTATVTAPTFTNVTAGTVSNSGTAVIPIKRINSTLTAGANVTAYVPTVLTLTLGGGRIRVLDSVGAEQFNQTTDATTELPAAATGTWTYRITKYGSNQITGSITIDGTTKTIAASYIPDLSVVDTQANAQAYTDLETTQKIYDYLAHYATTATGIVDGVLAAKGFGTLTVPAGLTLNPAAGAMVTVAAGVVTAKSSGLAEQVTLLSSGNITAPTLSNAVKLRALNLDSELVYSVDSLTFYPSPAARDAGTTPGATVTGGVYRFKSGAVVSGVTLAGTVYMRVRVGVTTLFAELAFVAGLNTLDLGVQTQLSAIAAKTNQLTFTVAGNLDANIQYVNDVQVAGTGSAGTPWGPV